jgi:hypothetical protein
MSQPTNEPPNQPMNHPTNHLFQLCVFKYEYGQNGQNPKNHLARNTIICVGSCAFWVCSTGGDALRCSFGHPPDTDHIFDHTAADSVTIVWTRSNNATTIDQRPDVLACPKPGVGTMQVGGSGQLSSWWPPERCLQCVVVIY